MPEETLGAQLAAYIGATYVENQAKSGAAVEDLTTQIQRLHLSHYDLILIQIGGNDILAFHEPKKTAKMLDKILDTLPDAGKIILLTAGNVGGATLIPHIARPFYTFINLKYHKEFEKVAQKRGISYVNLYKKPSEDPFIQNPDEHLAPDGLHPSAKGYMVWFETLKRQIEGS
jgi:lysophospholipase L1-like esterase